MFESVSMQQSVFMKHYELTQTHDRRGADEEHYTLADDFYSDADDRALTSPLAPLPKANE